MKKIALDLSLLMFVHVSLITTIYAKFQNAFDFQDKYK